MPADRRLIMLTRYPKPGRTKTRLEPLLGPEGAAELHKFMTEHTLGKLDKLQGKHSVDIEIRFEGGSRKQMQQWLGPERLYIPQGSGTLGHRMALAFHDSFRLPSVKYAIIIGTDCPAITTELLWHAFLSLGEKQVVIGPSRDGGYYLIGLRKEAPNLFRGIPWGGNDVLEKTLMAAHATNLQVQLLDLLIRWLLIEVVQEVVDVQRQGFEDHAAILAVEVIPGL